LISAKRNKEGVVTISGLINLDFYNIGVAEGGKELYIKSMSKEGFLVPIEDESEPKFIPTHEELLEWGFIETDVTTVWLLKKDTDFIYYGSKGNWLTWNNFSRPFHTKQDFMKSVGVEENINPHNLFMESAILKVKWKDSYTDTINAWEPKEINELIKVLMLIDKRENQSSAYIPSEKTLVDLGFTRNLTGWDKKFFTELRYIGYTVADNEFEDEDGNPLFLHSDTELKMLVEILGREK